MRLFPWMLLGILGCDDAGNEQPRRTVYDIVPQGVIEAEWTEAQKECAALWLAYTVRWAECSTVPEGAIQQLEDDGRFLVTDACIENDWGMDMGTDCADAWANDTCQQVYEQACDLWAPGEGRMPGQPAP